MQDPTELSAAQLSLRVSPQTLDTLRQFEASLDPAHPERSPGARAIGHGEVSAVFALDALPGQVCKRMAGFRDTAAVQHYLGVVGRYIERLSQAGVRVVTTAAVPVHEAGQPPVVFLLQPHLDRAGLGNTILHRGDDAALFGCLNAILATWRQVMLANRAAPDGRTAAVDSQLSNWHFAAVTNERPPLLIDIGTPFMRKDGIDEIDIGLFLAPAPPLIRQLYRRTRAVETYLDAFFKPRMVLIDLLGNFHKEGRPDRIDTAIAHVNQWIAVHAADLEVKPITRAAVDAYYNKDAKLLELYLKIRRLDRFVRTRLLGQRYSFVLPGPIKR